MSEQLALTLDITTPITVHCFACPHTVVGADPDDAHDRMEEHYAAKHAKLIAKLAWA